MSADSLMDKKKCEILVTKVERKDLGKWRLKEKYYIMTPIFKREILYHDTNFTPTFS